MTTTKTPARALQMPLLVPEEELRAKFNRAAFAVGHSLVGHPAFTMDNLSSLLRRRQQADKVLWNAGDKSVTEQPYAKSARNMSVEEAMEHIESTKSWIVLLDAHHEPEIQEVLDAAIAQTEALLGWPLSRAIKNRKALVLITSPHRITPFHIDRECTFLLQVHGNKVIHLFSPQDREMLKEEELERFWSGDNNAAHYRPEYQDHAFTFNMTPGTGVHIPVNAGHWLQNGDAVSISLGLHFEFQNHRLANIYRANHFLRKAGITPVPPGRGPLRDAIKGWGMKPAIAVAKRLLRSSEEKSYG